MMRKYFKNIYLGVSTVIVGMIITFKHLFERNVTVQYPDVHPTDKSGHDKMPMNARNRLFLDIEDCNGCSGCARACPVQCIDLETVKVVPGDDAPELRSGGKRGLWVTRYNIDFAKCCFCALCLEPCPTGAIKMTPEFEYSTDKRENLLYTFAVMPDDEVAEKKEMAAKFAAEKKKKAAAAKAAKAAAAKKEAEAKAKEEAANPKAEAPAEDKPAAAAKAKGDDAKSE
jgi:NADH-quinone oxidoreductase subunit I